MYSPYIIAQNILCVTKGMGTHGHHMKTKFSHHFQISEYLLTPVHNWCDPDSYYQQVQTALYCYPFSKGYCPCTDTEVPQDLRLVARKHSA